MLLETPGSMLLENDKLAGEPGFEPKPRSLIGRGKR
jgi:hypothetical protein